MDKASVQMILSQRAAGKHCLSEQMMTIQIVVVVVVAIEFGLEMVSEVLDCL